MLTDAAGVLSSAQSRLAAAATALTTLSSALPTAANAPLATPATLDALRNATDVLVEMRGTLTNNTSSTTLPGWETCLTALDDACRDLDPFLRLPFDNSDASQPQHTSPTTASSSCHSIAQCVEQVQLWVQGVVRASLVDNAAAVEVAHQLPPILQALHLGGCRMGASRAVSAASAAVHALTMGRVPAAELRGMLGMLAAACHVACLEHVILYKALAKLGYVVASVLVGVVVEGFCTPEGDDTADGTF